VSQNSEGKAVVLDALRALAKFLFSGLTYQAVRPLEHNFRGRSQRSMHRHEGRGDGRSRRAGTRRIAR
jgi:hypothetical protein